MIAHYANPVRFMKLSQWLWKWLALIGFVSLACGLYFVFTSPPDYQQGITVRILFIHVPSAWMAQMVYGLMAVASISAFIWRVPLADIIAQRAALIGTAWVIIAIVSGALWGRHSWGHFWAWDARLISVVILLLLYLGYMALLAAIENRQRAAIVARLIAIVGAVNLPIIKFSVDWWNTLHQPASLLRAQGPALAPVFLLPLALMMLAALCLTFFLLCVRVRSEIMRRQIETILLKELSS